MQDRGLLRKAIHFKNYSNSVAKRNARAHEGDPLTPGISEADQEDIRLQIDQIAQSNRMKADELAWKVIPKKHGFVLPLLVNVGAAGVLALGIFTLSTLFAASENQALNETVQLSSAEGRLVAEIRREAEGAIQEKDKEINEIQVRLEVIERERSQLAANVEQQIQAREAELRAQLDVELQQERQRLIAEGLSEEVIQERLRAFEEEKNAAFQAELARYSAEVEEERIRLQNSLDAAQREFNSNLAAATAERQTIQEESRRREQELRAQMDAQNEELEAARAEAAASLQSAQAELTALNQTAARAQAAEDQLIGLYTSIRAAIREGRIEDATRGLDSLRTYLNDPSVISVQSLARRRDIDLFAIDLIDRTLAAERARTSSDTARLSESLAILSSIRESASQARAAASAGDRTRATTLYRQVIQTLPEILEAQQYTQDRSAAELQNTTTAALSSLGQAYSAGDWVALDRSFEQLLSSLPLTDPQIATTLRQLKEGTENQTQQTQQTRQTEDANPGLTSANLLLNQQQYTAAISAYTNLLSTYPLANQASQFVGNINEAARRLNNQYSSFQSQTRAEQESTQGILEENAVQISEQRQQIAQLQQELSATQRQLTSSQQTISNLQSQFQRAEEGRLSALEQIEELRLQLTAAQIAADATATAAAQTTPDGASASDQESGISEEEFVNLQAQAEELAVVAARYEQVLTNYQQYALLEDRILAETTSQTLVQGRNTMNTFFSTPEVADIMPGMQDRIDRYITAAGELGTTEVLFNASDIVDGALRIQDVGVRDRYFVDLLGRYQDNEGMTEFIQTLQRTLP
ncbi:MAG: hypothetical protein GW949_06135 [Spirochaetales bacterium]|nr:hypothetical protein [Spirochaetales bacterium]